MILLITFYLLPYKQKPRLIMKRGSCGLEKIDLTEALLVIIHHLAPQTVLDGEHLTHRDDLAALLADVLRGLAHGPGMFFGFLTGLCHFCDSFASSHADLRVDLH